MTQQVVFEKVALRFEGPNVSYTEVFRDLSFTVQKGEFLAIVGPSGCGKTSIEMMACGLMQPTSGEILIRGIQPEAARQQRLLSYVFQHPVLLRWRTVRQNILLPAEIVGLDGQESRADKLISLVGLDGFANAYPDMLSGGMRSRVQLARALLLEPEGLAMDECFGDLDEITRFRMNIELLRIWNFSRPTIIFVTHSVEEAVFLSDRVLVLGQRPAGIIDGIEINLPRPRLAELVDTEAYRNTVARVRKSLANVPLDPLGREGPHYSGGNKR